VQVLERHQHLGHVERRVGLGQRREPVQQVEKLAALNVKLELDFFVWKKLPPRRDSISRPIGPVSSVAGGDDTTRPHRPEPQVWDLLFGTVWKSDRWHKKLALVFFLK
jgi:hypothetical protein